MVERQPSPSAQCRPRERENAFVRQDAWALFLGGVLVVGAYLWLCGREALHNAPASAVPSGSAEAAPLRAVLVVVSVQVAPTKANGSRWDAGFNGLPDPCVVVVNQTQGSRHRTARAEDTLEAAFDCRTVAVREGDEIQVRVDDVDLQFDDLVGEHHFRVTREMIEQGELILEFGQVKRLTLRFAR